MKIAFIGAVPPTAVFPDDCIHLRYRKPAHPAPWIGGLLPELARISNFQLRVIVPHRAITKHCLVKHEGVEYEGLPSPMLERFAPHSLYLSKSLVVGPAIKRFKPDLIHAFGMENGSATIALRHRVPVSCFIQGIAERLLPFYNQRSFINKKVAVRCERRAVKRIQWMIAETDFAKEWALNHNPEAEVRVVPHPLRPEFLDAESSPNSGRIITVGGLDDRKGMDTIISAFALIDNQSATLSVVGNGPCAAELRQLAEDLGIGNRVHFHGVLDTNGIIREFSRSSIFAIGSRMDTSPNVLTEAHAVGLPVVGTRAGGIPEMIDDGVDGFHVDVDDHIMMAKKISVFLNDPDLTQRMGQAGKEKVRVLNDPLRVAQGQLDFFVRIFEQLKI